MFCHKCGTELPEKAEFCHKCGAKQTAPKETQPSANIQEIKTGQSVSTEINDFKNFVDNRVRQTTNFQSAEELLNSRVPQNFLWLCFGIPAVIVLILGIKSGTILDIGTIAGALLGSELLLGYPAALLTDFFRGWKAKGAVQRTDVEIDKNKLIQFLNGHLSPLFPQFREWGYLSTNIQYSFAFGKLLSSTKYTDAASGNRVGTIFGRRIQRCFVEIWIEPDKTDSESKQTISFGTAIASVVPSKYSCMVRAAPILQAAMEYYLKLSDKEIERQQTVTQTETQIERRFAHTCSQCGHTFNVKYKTTENRNKPLTLSVLCPKCKAKEIIKEELS